MLKNKKEFRELKEKVLHPKDDLFTILFINFFTLRLVYYMRKYKVPITPNQISYSRLFLFTPLIILFLFLAPFYGNIWFYLLAIISCYFWIMTDWLDGQLARATDQTSDKGEFLDAIADRVSTIIFLVVIFSIGLWYNNYYIMFGSIILFVLKTFHMMVITKLFYFGMEEGYDNQKVFDGHDAFNVVGVNFLKSTMKKMNKILKIKSWGADFGGSDRFFITVMLPLIIVFLKFNTIATWLSYFYILIWSVFFIIRIKNLLKDIK